MAYTSTRRNGRDYDIYLIDPADPSARRLLAEGEGFSNVVDWSADDDALLVIEAISAAESCLWRVDVATGEREPLTPRGGERPISFAGAAFAALAPS